jgi:hypothetical protein
MDKKKKPAIKVRDLTPKKDAKGGRQRAKLTYASDPPELPVQTAQRANRLQSRKQQLD